jgi:hypothetical protein
MVKLVVFFVMLSVATIGGALTALRGVQADDEELMRMAKLIGTRNARRARLICWTALLVLGPCSALVVGVGIWCLYLS